MADSIARPSWTRTTLALMAGGFAGFKVYCLCAYNRRIHKQFERIPYVGTFLTMLATGVVTRYVAGPGLSKLTVRGASFMSVGWNLLNPFLLAGTLANYILPVSAADRQKLKVRLEALKNIAPPASGVDDVNLAVILMFARVLWVIAKFIEAGSLGGMTDERTFDGGVRVSDFRKNATKPEAIQKALKHVHDVGLVHLTETQITNLTDDVLDLTDSDNNSKISLPELTAAVMTLISLALLPAIAKEVGGGSQREQAI